MGYLLDPYQDHGLGYEFLDRFLKVVHGDNHKNTYSYNFEIELEQAFRDGDKSKQIVDIVLASFHNKKNGFKESIMQNAIEAKQTLEFLYLIENKVSYNAKKPEQIKQQFEATKSQLKVTDDKIYSIYITPELSVYDTEFDSFVSNSKTHFKWILENEKPASKEIDDDSNDNTQTSIYGIIKSIIEDESYGKIEAINEYTKHTLISFLKFIENEFKSETQEEKDKKEGRINDGSYTQKYIDINDKTNIEEKLNNLRTELVKRNTEWDMFLSKPNLSKPRFPYLTLEHGAIDIQIHAGAETRDKIGILYRSNNRDVNSFDRLVQISEKLNTIIKKADYKKDAYTRTDIMQRKKMAIDNFDEIFEELNIAINQIS